VIIAYLLPRVLGRRWPQRIVMPAIPWMERAAVLLAPFIPSRDASPRNALAAVLSGDSSVLAATDEIEVVSGVLAFADRPVGELMTPRTAIVAIPEGMLAAEAAHVYAQSGYSRYPVYRGTLDEIVGAVHAFDLLHLAPDEPVRLRPVLSVPGSRRAADLMLEMQRGGSHLAVVVDEFGGTAGLVTFEDLLRDLVSEVLESPEATDATTPSGTLLVEFEGAAPASELVERLGTGPRAAGAQTVGGLLSQALGRIPRTGERFRLGELEFDVLAASATRVERVAVRRGAVPTVVLDQRDG
jgi:magnesium and cobalt transporter